MILKCTKCNLEKDESEFPASESQLPARNYRGHRCNACKREIYRQRAEIVCEQQRNRYHAKRDEIIVQKRKSYKKYYDNNKERCLARHKEFIRNNPDYASKYNKEYMPEYLKEYYQRPIIALNRKIRSRFRSWLKSKNAPKEHHVQDLIGLGRDEFLYYIENQFVDGMTWENIHIDHYIPLSYFDPTDDLQCRIAWNYRNMRPLFAEDNLKKSYIVPSDAEEYVEMIKKHLTVSQE